MKKIGKRIILCIVIIIAAVLLIIKEIVDGKYDAVIKCSSLMIGFAIFSSLDFVYQKKISMEVKVKYKLNKLFTIFYIILLIMEFYVSIASNNFIISNASSGLIFPSTYFLINKKIESFESSYRQDN